MNNAATVVILAPTAHGRGGAMNTSMDDLFAYGSIQTTLHNVLASQLPTVLVCDKTLSGHARSLLPGNCIVEHEPGVMHPDDALLSTMEAGMLASSQSDGWLFLPASASMLKARTLQLVAQALGHNPIAYPRYQARRGVPMGFGRELFSELIHLHEKRDLTRLLSRYPAECIDVDDPGVLLHQDQFSVFHTEPLTSSGAGHHLAR